MFNMQNMSNWLNRIEQGSPTRLDPASAEFVTKYMESYIQDTGISDKKGQPKKVDINKFAQDMFGEEVELPKEFKNKFQGEKIKIISLNEFKAFIKSDSKYSARYSELEKIAQKMSELQPQVKGLSILTESQAKDILSGGHINNPEFLQEFYKNRFGKKFMKQYQFVAQNELDAYKQELENYVKSIIKKVKGKNLTDVTEKILHKASNANLKWNAINWGAGFVTSALFLSTLIPKMQYQITKWRTGSDEFPGTAQFRENEQKV